MQKVNSNASNPALARNNPNHMSETNLVKGKCGIDDYLNQYDRNQMVQYGNKDLYLLQNTNAMEQIYNLQQQSYE